MTSQRDLVHAYRTLYRAGLKAVQFSSPARYTVRQILRTEFRVNGPSCFDSTKVQNTAEFLGNAASAVGLEHKIVKSLLHVWWFPHFSKKTGLATISPFRRLLQNLII